MTVGRNGVLYSYIGGFNENSNPLGGGSKDFINLGGVAENSSSNQIDNPLGDSNGSSSPFSNNTNAPSDH